MRKWLAGLILIVMTFSVAIGAAEGTENIRLDIDQSTVSDGYITVMCPETDLKLKINVEKGGQTYQYDLWNQPVVLPLQMGEGEYTVTLEGFIITEEPSGDDEEWDSAPVGEYSLIDQMVITAEIDNPLSCFLHPNCYVDYDSESPWVIKAEEIAGYTTDPMERFRNITNYVVKNFQYDFIKSVTVAGSSGMLPDTEYCWRNKMGISLDLSALTCSMLRAQDIPAILVYGTIGNGTKHSWVEAVINDEHIRFDPSAEVNATDKSEEYSTDNAVY